MGTVAGTVLRYGDLATLPFGQERVLPGRLAICPPPSCIANRMHSGTSRWLTPTLDCGLTTMPIGYTAETDLIDTSYGRDDGQEVKTGRLRGHVDCVSRL